MSFDHLFDSQDHLIFVVDDDPARAQRVVLWLGCEDYRCEAFLSVAQLVERLKTHSPHVLCTTLWTPSSLPEWPLPEHTALILLSDDARTPLAQEAVRQGVYDWLPLPPPRERLLTATRNAAAYAALRERSGASTTGAREKPAIISRPPTGEGFDGEKTILPMEEVERRAILRALEVTRGNISCAARHLRLGRATLYRKLSQYGIDPSIERV